MSTSPVAFRLDRIDQRRSMLASARTGFVGLSVLALLLGLVGGWTLGQRSSETPTPVTAAPIEEVVQPTASAITNAPNTERGAIRAATGFVSLYTSLLDHRSAADEKALLGVIDPSAKDLSASVRSGLTAGQASLIGGEAQGKVHFSPLRTITNRTGNSVTVSVWSVLITAGGDQSVANSNWFTNEVSLTHSTKGWTVKAWKVTPGPTPALSPGSAASDAATLAPFIELTDPLQTAVVEPKS